MFRRACRKAAWLAHRQLTHDANILEPMHAVSVKLLLVLLVLYIRASKLVLRLQGNK